MKQTSPGVLTYSKYLKVNELISLQQPLSNPVVHDEMLFIVVHQTYELWFRQILHELEAISHNLKRGEVLYSTKLIGRICEIVKILIDQIEILETMTPVEFNRFRSQLNPASGFQSVQFRKLEILSGLDSEAYSAFSALEPEWISELGSVASGQSIRQSFFVLLKEQGLFSEREDFKAALQKIYHGKDFLTLQDLCEQLIRYDELFSGWRFRHIQMVERMIGMKKGTGGSLGVSYLQQTLKLRFFPELWEIRTEMNGGY